MLKQDLVKFVLGSSSPRRRDMLTAMGMNYELIKPDFDEMQQPGELPLDYVKRNSSSKADWVLERIASRTEDSVIICADTIVVLNGRVYEKPRDPGHARMMLGELCGKTHTVMTALTVVRTQPVPRMVTKVVETAVTLKKLDAAAIAAYVASGEPLDKAGSYAIQGVGGFMVERIEGSYSNVVGLPLSELVSMLEDDFALTLWKKN